MSGMMIGAQLVDTEVGMNTKSILQAHPKRFAWAKMNLDTGAEVNTCPLDFDPDGAGDGRFYRDGQW